MLDDIFRIHCLGRWLPSQVLSNFSNHNFILPGDLPARAQKFWDELVSRRPGFFNGALCRLESFDASPAQFELRLSRTCYRDLLFCNEHAAEILKSFGEQSLVRALGISVVIETADGFLPLMKRSEKMGEGPGLIDVFGGHVHPDQHAQHGIPDVFLAMADEMHTELGLLSEHCDGFSCIGLLENWQTRKPELVFEARLRLTLAELHLEATHAKERDEYVEILAMAAKPQESKAFLEHNAKKFTPVGYGCLSLFGMLRKWW
jgi:hypothetical protein